MNEEIEESLCVRALREGGEVCQVQVEGPRSIVAIRRKGKIYEFQVAGRSGVPMDKDTLLEYIAGLAQLAR